MLIDSPRLRPEDRAAWRALASTDLAWARTAWHGRLVEEAEAAIIRFARAPCYAGVSWGKDSSVLADLVARVAPQVPIVWVHVRPIASPECVLVRDAFLELHPHVRYDEITVECRIGPDGTAHATGTLEAGFRAARSRHGARHISGLRADESAGRGVRHRRWGLESPGALAPLGRWSADHVFAYLAARRVPTHPAYAMTFGGAIDRRHIRVASIGLRRGRGTGRLEWERAYYPEVVRWSED